MVTAPLVALEILRIYFAGARCWQWIQFHTWDCETPNFFASTVWLPIIFTDLKMADIRLPHMVRQDLLYYETVLSVCQQQEKL